MEIGSQKSEIRIPYDLDHNRVRLRIPISGFRFLRANARHAWVRHQAWDNSCMSVQADRAIRTGKLNALLRLHTQPINVVVFHGSRRDLVLRLVSRLDAFSGYLVRT